MNCYDIDCQKEESLVVIEENEKWILYECNICGKMSVWGKNSPRIFEGKDLDKLSSYIDDLWTRQEIEYQRMQEKKDNL